MRAFLWALRLVCIAQVCAGGYRDNQRKLDLNEAADISDEEGPLLAGWQDHATNDGWAGDEQNIHFGNVVLPETSSHALYGMNYAANNIHATYGSGYVSIPYTPVVHQYEQPRHHGESSQQRVVDHRHKANTESNARVIDSQHQPVAPHLIVPEHLSLARQTYLRTGQKGGFFLEEAPKTPLQVQLLFESEWDRRRLGYALSPRELAEAVSEMKLELGYDAQIGHAASKRVRKDTAEGEGQHVDYLRDFTAWQNRFTRKIITLRKTYAGDSAFKNDEDRAKAVYIHFRNIVEKTYDGKRKLQDVCSQKAMQQLDAKMRSVWKAFMEERIRPALGQNVDESTIPLELIEYYSRDFHWKEQKRQATTECIKRYMMQVLQRHPRESLRFTALRSEWRQEIHSGSRQRKSQEGKGKEGGEK